MTNLWCGILLLGCGVNTLYGQSHGDLRERLKDANGKASDLWVYNDIAKGMAEGKRQNKPVFVTFRCVPCKDCAAFDAEVAKGNERILKLARENFICVRQVEMKDVDLSQFQFDYDLNWAGMFVNGDGTVYARYGTQSADGPDAYNSIAGLEKTMQRVLAMHANYPANAAELKDKVGPFKGYRTPFEMPFLHQKERRMKETTRANCIHCHNIHDAENAHAQKSGTFTRDMLWRYPLPENLGLKIDGSDGAKISSVTADSPAAKAGLRVGQTITHANGQPITSIADLQWVLHNLPNTVAQVCIKTQEGGECRLSLAPGWKKTDISWRGSIYTIQPRFPVWTPPPTSEVRKQNGIGEKDAALHVRWIEPNSPSGIEALKAGIEEGDLIVAIGGKPVPSNAAKLNVEIKLNYKIGEKLPLTILRKGVRKDVVMNLVE